MTRPRAADDFGVIRARIEELRGERGQASPERSPRQPGPRPYHAAATPSSAGSTHHLARAIRQKLFRKRLGKVSSSRMAAGLGN